MKKIFALVAFTAMLAGGAGVLTGRTISEDPCRDLATVSSEAMRINTTILNATTAFLKANTAGDAAGMVSASVDMTDATDKLDGLKTRYDAAERKCHV